MTVIERFHATTH